MNETQTHDKDVGVYDGESVGLWRMRFKTKLSNDAEAGLVEERWLPELTKLTMQLTSVEAKAYDDMIQASNMIHDEFRLKPMRILHNSQKHRVPY